MVISIITVCFNSGKTIRDTIKSVGAQTFSDIEYIVVDGGSTDETLSIISEYKGLISKVISEPDDGIFDAMNKGVSVATGDVIGILNSDDFYSSRTVIEDVAGHFSPGLDLVIGDVSFFSPDNLGKAIRSVSASRFKPWQLRFGWMPPHPACFIRSSAYHSVGLYKSYYKLAADYELLVRCFLVAKLNYVCIPETLVFIRTGGAGTSGFAGTFVASKEIVQSCRENGVYTNLFLVCARLPIKWLLQTKGYFRQVFIN